MKSYKKQQKSVITLLKNRRLQLDTSTKSHPQYDIHNPDAIQQLENAQKGKHKFKYLTTVNNTKTTPKLIIAPISILDDRLGVYANQNIKKSNKCIGYYAGKRGKRHVNAKSLYVFEIQDKNDEPIEFIDADKNRDWTGFINHSVTPNLYVKQRKIKGKINICFYPLRNIKKGEQLTYDYGKYYFVDSGIKPFFLQTDNNWLSDEEVFLQNKAYYAPGLYSFDANTRRDLQLGESSQTAYLIPSIFLPIESNNVTALKKALKNDYPINCLVYSCNSKIHNASQQQHLTALMFACYLGNEKMIQTLLEHKADVDRCMLVSGYSALTTLMLGRASDATVQKMGMMLLSKMSYPILQDEYQLSFLHYAIMRNASQLVKRILSLYDKEQFDWLEMVLERDSKLPAHANFDHCLLNGKLEVLTLLMRSAINDFILKDNLFINAINKRAVFSKQVLSASSHENLLALEKILKRPEFKALQKSTLTKRLASVLRKMRTK